MDGWIKLHRKVLDNPVVCKDAETLAIWIYLLTHATHAEMAMLFGGKKTTLKPGQLITGRKSIASKLKISESKVQRTLKLFEIEQQIEQRTDRQSRLVAVVNWGQYQQSEQQSEQGLNNDRTTSEQRLNTNKNVKNVKNNTARVQPKKTKYADFVSMTDDEYNKLIATYGQDNTSKMIEVLDNYKGANGKKYASDYRAILNWVVERVGAKQITEEKRDPVKEIGTWL